MFETRTQLRKERDAWKQSAQDWEHAAKLWEVAYRVLVVMNRYGIQREQTPVMENESKVVH